jgi:hypothetical protein
MLTVCLRCDQLLLPKATIRSARGVQKHVHSILMKLRLPETEDDHRRVLAVVTYLDAR